MLCFTCLRSAFNCAAVSSKPETFRQIVGFEANGNNWDCVDLLILEMYQGKLALPEGMHGDGTVILGGHMWFCKEFIIAYYRYCTCHFDFASFVAWGDQTPLVLAVLGSPTLFCSARYHQREAVETRHPEKITACNNRKINKISQKEMC